MDKALTRKTRLAGLLLLVGGLLLVVNLSAASEYGAVTQESDKVPSLETRLAGSIWPDNIALGDAYLIGDNFLIAESADINYPPAITRNEITDEYMVVWRYDATTVFGQRVGGGGELLGGNFPIADHGYGYDLQYPAIAWSGTTHEYLVVWSAGVSSFWRNIYGRRLGSSGVLLGDTIVISNDGPDNWDDRPAVIWNAGRSGYMVVWEDSSKGAFPMPSVQRIRDDGSLEDSKQTIRSYKSYSPAMAWNAKANECLVVWRLDSSPDRILGQRIGANGALLGDEFDIGTRGERPEVAWNASTNEYLVVWNSGGSVYGQRIAASGTLLGGTFIVGYGEQPAVAWNVQNNEYLVVFTVSTVSITSDVYGQRIGESGTLLGDEFAIGTAPGLQQLPMVTWNETTDQYLVVWVDNNNRPLGVSAGSLRGQRIGYRPTPTPTATLTKTPTATNTPTATPTLTSTPTKTPQVEFGKAVSHSQINPGEMLVYTLTLDNRRSAPVALRITDTLPLNLKVELTTLPTQVTYESAGHLVLWQGTLAPQTQQDIAFQVQVSAEVTNTLLVNRAFLDDGRGVRQAYASTVIGTLRTYLPLVLRRWPPIPDAPVLNAITAPGAAPSYTVSWNQAYLAASYILEQATNATFSDTMQVYAGPATSRAIPSQGIAAYYYRVKARNEWGDSSWSNVQTVEVRWEREPNYPSALANGPLVSGLDYYGYPNDAQDYFTFQTTRRGEITVDLTNHTGQGVQLVLYYPRDVEVARVFAAPYHLVFTGDPGAYYVQIYSTGGHNNATPYTLRATFP